jgi:hypothetical protein
MTLQLKRATGIIHSQQMASIAPIVIECNDYLAYGTIRSKIKLEVFSRQKAVDEPCWEMAGWRH